MGKVIGIDLGTTNSCVAFVDDGVPTVIAAKGGYKTTPSVVAMSAQGKRIVGHAAKRQAITNPENTVAGIKRFMGRSYDDPVIQAALISSPFQLTEGPANDPRIVLQGKEYAVPEISAMILTELKRVAEAQIGENITQAVITVPAYFLDAQRQATKDAGRIAGLEVLRLLNEPTAAALAYGFGKNTGRQRIAVYDLGGGTFDISILDIDDGTYEVLTSNGDTFLGGEDFDSRIMEWLFDEFLNEHGIDLRADPMAVQRLKDAAEQAKIGLSSLQEAEINLPFVATNDAQEALHLQRKLSRADLEQLVGDLVERTVEICERAVQDAGLRPRDIDGVILVGGQTRMPMVQQLVARFFGSPPLKNVNPDEAVALGAAIQGGLLTAAAEERKGHFAKKALLLDLTPFALGIEITRGMFKEIVPKDTPIPTSRSMTFTTERDNQTEVKIRILQGEGDFSPKNAHPLGEFTLLDVRPAPRGDVHIKVTFDIDADGTVHVQAIDEETGQEQSITVASNSYLSEREIAGMIEDNRDYLLQVEQDELQKQLELTVQTLLGQVNQMLSGVEKSLTSTEQGRNALIRIRSVIGLAEIALATANSEKLVAIEDPLRRIHELLSSMSAR